VDDEMGRPELDETDLLEGADDGVEVFVDELIVGDVAGGDDEEPARGAVQEVAVAEVSVLGDDDPVLGVCELGDRSIGGPVAVG